MTAILFRGNELKQKQLDRDSFSNMLLSKEAEIPTLTGILVSEAVDVAQFFLSLYSGIMMDPPKDEKYSCYVIIPHSFRFWITLWKLVLMPSLNKKLWGFF